jgi:PTS system ascorbate-specific IIA component
MKTGLLFITHGNLGREILDTVTAILGLCPLTTETIKVPNGCDPDAVLATAVAACDRLDQGYGVLVLTDLYGSTPSNIANRLVNTHNVCVVSGVNVPMLLRIVNYPDSKLDKLGEIAVSGARDGVVITSKKQAS